MGFPQSLRETHFSVAADQISSNSYDYKQEELQGLPEPFRSIELWSVAGLRRSTIQASSLLAFVCTKPKNVEESERNNTNG